jgi:hypothetical protein
MLRLPKQRLQFHGIAHTGEKTALKNALLLTVASILKGVEESQGGKGRVRLGALSGGALRTFYHEIQGLES